MPLETGPLAPPGTPAIVDVGAHDDAPHVGVRLDVRPQPWPGEVQLGQGGLQHVVGAVPVAADGVGDPAQVGLAGGDVLDVRRVPLVRPSAHRSPSPEATWLRTWSTNPAKVGSDSTAASTGMTSASVAWPRTTHEPGPALRPHLGHPVSRGGVAVDQRHRPHLAQLDPGERLQLVGVVDGDQRVRDGHVPTVLERDQAGQPVLEPAVGLARVVGAALVPRSSIGLP